MFRHRARPAIYHGQAKSSNIQYMRPRLNGYDEKLTCSGMPRETAHLSAAMSGKFVYMEYLSALLAFLVMATVSVGSHLHQPPMIAWAVTIGMQVVFGGLGTVFMTWVMSAHPNSQIPWSMGFFWVVTGKQRERSTRLGEI
ncbi:hypothetical protein TrLO_g3661 [Triparma laevis f. longispina]|uniref:Uncharacterized protein n=1 Tax=Triparma laevis f. longispina TaxID=1714387 RepID=A0A9W7F5N5_9STRA|nr:hypothetical protein TrLO_g3661 [Triparma laevis f. longispina]